MKYVVRNKTKMCEMKISKSELTETLNQHCFKISHLLGLTLYDVEVYDVPQNQCMTKMCLFVLKPAKFIEQVMTVTQTTLSRF